MTKGRNVSVVFGCTGQDGSILSRLLIDRNDIVIGVTRRSSTDNTQRLRLLNLYLPCEDYNDIEPNFQLMVGDVTDTSSIRNVFGSILKKCGKIDYIYNMSAQSHVKVSFSQPSLTWNVNASGVLNLLEIHKDMRLTAKLLQASSSEMYGNNFSSQKKNGGKLIKFQDENTPFAPNSPYAISKLASYHLIKSYREAYNIPCCSSISFNHESIPKHFPVLIKNIKNNFIDILPIEDMFYSGDGRYTYKTILPKYKQDMQIWDGVQWTNILAGTCYRDMSKKMRLIQTRSCVCETTHNHIVCMKDDIETKCQNVKVGDEVFDSQYPLLCQKSDYCDKILSHFMGFVCRDGNIDENGKITLTGCDKNLLLKEVESIISIYGYGYSLINTGVGDFKNCTKDVWKLNLHNHSSFGQWIKSNIYTKRSKEKRVPSFILNADHDIQKAFLDGYYMADGRIKGNERYYYKGFTTKSATLCLGLLTIINNVLHQIPKVKCEYKDKDHRCYYIQLRSANNNKVCAQENLSEVIKIFDTESEDGWFYDLQTESNFFAIGPNLMRIHNSPLLRGEHFVTRKIAKFIADLYIKWTNGKLKLNRKKKARKINEWSKHCEYIPYGLHNSDKLPLGNLNACRDWGHAVDFCKGMILILENDKLDDFVLATGETHSVMEFLQESFSVIGLSKDKDYIMKFVRIDPRFYRPCEVNYLCGDYSKVKNKLKWSPLFTFKDLVKSMVENEIRYKLGQKIDLGINYG